MEKAGQGEQSMARPAVSLPPSPLAPFAAAANAAKLNQLEAALELWLAIVELYTDEDKLRQCKVPLEKAIGLAMRLKRYPQVAELLGSSPPTPRCARAGRPLASDALGHPGSQTRKPTCWRRWRMKASCTSACSPRWSFS
jgi:hypothetical protein